MLTRGARSFQKCNYTTACCFKYKTNCADCPNRVVCELYSEASKNEYHIHPIKFAMLMTYANIGLEGLEEELIRGFKQIEEEEKKLYTMEYFLL